MQQNLLHGAVIMLMLMMLFVLLCCTVSFCARDWLAHHGMHAVRWLLSRCPAWLCKGFRLKKNGLNFPEERLPWRWGPLQHGSRVAALHG